VAAYGDARRTLCNTSYQTFHHSLVALAPHRSSRVINSLRERVSAGEHGTAVRVVALALVYVANPPAHSLADSRCELSEPAAAAASRTYVRY